MGDPPGGNNVFNFQRDDDLPEDIVDIIRDGTQPILDKANVSAIAVTGAPSNLPAVVVFPNN